MKSILYLLLLPLFISCGSNQSGKAKGPDKQGIDTANDMYYVTAEDASMNAAISKARMTVGEFDRALQSNDPAYADFAVKKGFKTSAGNEHMWIGDVQLVNGHYRGVVNNVAESTKEVKMGDTVVVRKEEISDWMYLDSNILRGGFTILEIRSKMTKEERKKMDEELYFIIKD